MNNYITGIFDSISLLFKVFLGIWDDLPEDQKEKIKTEISNCFEELLRQFFRS